MCRSDIRHTCYLYHVKPDSSAVEDFYWYVHVDVSQSEVCWSVIIETYT